MGHLAPFDALGGMSAMFVRHWTGAPASPERTVKRPTTAANTMALFRKKRAEPTEDGLEDEIAVVARVLVNYPPGSPPPFGAPTRCPVCTTYGLVESMDPVRRASNNRCVSCGEEWVITARALRAARDLPVVAPAVAPTEGGILVPAAAAAEPIAEPTDHFALDWGPPPDLDKVVIDGGQPVPVAAATDLTLLLVEDDPADADLVRLVLEPYEAARISLLHAETRAEGERLVSRHDEIDLVLLDLGLPDSRGLATLSNWRPARPSPPVVVLSGNGNSGLVEASRQLGAAMYVNKQDLLGLTDGPGVDELVDAFRALSLEPAGAGAPALDPPASTTTF